MKKVLCILLALALIFSMAACGETKKEEPPKQDDQPKEWNEWPDFLALAAASSGGDAFLGLSAIAEVLTEKTPMTVSAQVTGGSNQNLRLMESGEVQFGFCTASVVHNALNGLNDFAEKPYSDFRYVWLYNTSAATHIVVRKGSGLTSVADFAGKRVVVGNMNSATELIAKAVIEASGVDYDSISKDYSGVQDGLDKLANGLADAAIFGGSAPVSSVMELMLADKVELIGLTDEAIEKCIASEPYEIRSVIPAGSYEGKVTKDINTLGSLTGLVCHKDVDEELVYHMCKVMVENIDDLASRMALFGKTNLEMSVQANEGEFHPGAVRYFKEIGVMK